MFGLPRKKPVSFFLTSSWLGTCDGVAEDPVGELWKEVDVSDGTLKTDNRLIAPMGKQLRRRTESV
jgi:hypothetical protein